MSLKTNSIHKIIKSREIGSFFFMENQFFINIHNYLVATRDSGYKNTASALAELVDNALDAHATKIEINIAKEGVDSSDRFEISVVDDGVGMTVNELNFALQFGGSSRFNSRNQLGRYGMGLPNSSLSQCRRVEIITWRKWNNILHNYLDLDEVINKRLRWLPGAQKIKNVPLPITTPSGTIVQWKHCDRLSFKYKNVLVKHIHYELGRIFRNAIWNGIEIKICDEHLLAFDPLFIRNGTNLIGGIPYGEVIKYQIKNPNTESSISEVNVRFIELPVKMWGRMSNEEKKKHQITKKAGVSILRSLREIDYGWFFMGNKRKENYDDWWRCEISFNPELDEVFGVTHIKQGIKETEFMKKILEPDLEQIARALNNRVRLNFIKLNIEKPHLFSKSKLERIDSYLSPLRSRDSHSVKTSKTQYNHGFEYEIQILDLSEEIFYGVKEIDDKIILTINKNHVFYDRIYRSLYGGKHFNASEFSKMIEILLFSAGRSELILSNGRSKKLISEYKKQWSAHLKSFLS